MYFVNDLKAGDIITDNDIRRIRPGFGLPPKFEDLPEPEQGSENEEESDSFEANTDEDNQLNYAIKLLTI